MRITTVRSEGLAALSYFVSSDGEAVVIDPRRDASIYAELALREGVDIRYVFETHRNEDYVIGSLELQSLVPDVEIGHSNAISFKFGEHAIADGETFNAGKMHITCLNTPGHTDDSICYVVSDKSSGPDPIIAFTGDTLFVNEVGRTDLVDINKHEEMSRKLFRSLHEKLLPIGDGVIIHPGHGAGSVCGGAIGDREFSTIGFERSNNMWLKMDEEEFVSAKTAQRLTRTSYFKRCEKLNTIGPLLLNTRSPPQELDAVSLANNIEDDNHRGIDTRQAKEFLMQFIPRTINLSLTNMGLLAGWTLKAEQTFSLILGNRKDLGQAWSYLVRVGLDDIVGFLKNGIDTWIQSGRPVESIRTLSTEELKKRVDTNSIRVVDVREPHEFSQNHIPGAISSPLTLLDETATSIDGNVSIAPLCPSGFRGTAAASILHRNGFTDIAVPIEGYKGWVSKGYPTEV
ncbi:MAG: MBL fold metallo-hydrolase [Candidatus Thorarchaeota archaeon]|nr:MBL fold metallo-hydrolase [Candidatus Thorarchaeota archaeon]